MSIRVRIILVFLPLIFLFLTILLFSNFSSSKTAVLELINHEAHEIAHARVMEFDVVIEASQKVAEGISTSIGIMNILTEEEVEEIIRETLKQNPGIYGSTVALIPGKTDLGEYSPYFHQTPEGFRYVSLANPDYNYAQRDWFKVPLEKDQSMWSKPYLDEGGGDVLMTTYSSLIHRNNTVVGVATVDISLDHVVQRIKKLTIGGRGYAFIVTKSGSLIAHPDFGVLSKETIFDMAKKSNNEDLKDLVKAVKLKDTNLSEIDDPFYGTPSLVLTTKIKSTSWTLVLIYPKDEVLQPLYRLKDKTLLASLFVLGLLVILIFWLSSSLTSPLTKLVEHTKIFSEGIFDKKLDETKGTKEIKELSKSFNLMGAAIIEQIENVKKTTSEKERYEQELKIAAEIQQSILPQTFPPFPELVDKIDLYGSTAPAREIGGDYYDFFPLTSERIGIVVADVSDKGAPSSFFMAMTRMLVREIAERGFTPPEIIRRANYMLSQDNPHCMFVTLVYGEYNVNTGSLRLVNAGHTHPIHITNQGEIKALELKTNLPLGIDETAYFKANEFKLNPGDSIFIYTDGITEAMNEAEEQFGDDRLIEVIKNNKGLTSEEMTKTILSKINNFAGKAKQHDDITMLLLKRKLELASKPIEQDLKLEEAIFLVLPAKTDILEKLSTITISIAKEIGFDEASINQIILALDEIVTNVIMHSYKSDSRETLKIDIIPRTDGICITIIDYGEPFNFKQAIKSYDEEEATLDQNIGGIGLHLAKKSTDKLWYEPSTMEGNKISFIKYLKK